ncbi:hypothetical protein INT47_007596 [Mucor saturninus]|uniref:Uncharacterized protein n=1 Tax=Mucor saturninus TaxID=64648 RepID=A0A8H7V4G6_9FUNG|nr:hypothetical protein INT47_007596 [Mucor saturninus]
MTDNLAAWPSDEKKFNVVEFYHKILWASQTSPIDEACHGNRRVTFSTEPPVIYEYEPEYPQRYSDHFKPPPSSRHSGENYNSYYYYLQPPTSPQDKEEEEDDDVDFSFFRNHRLMKTRSLCDFKPIPNGDFNSFLYPTTTTTLEDLDPPPSYIEYNVYREPMEDPMFIPNNNKKLGKKQSMVWVGQAFLQKTLRKIKSSPRLMMARRSSMLSLRKNKSFFSLSA